MWHICGPWNWTVWIVEPNVTTLKVSDEFESETVLTDEMTGDDAMPIIQSPEHFWLLYMVFLELIIAQ